MDKYFRGKERDAAAVAAVAVALEERQAGNREKEG